MKELRDIYFSMQMTLFPMPEEEKIEISEKMKEFLNILELVKPSRFFIFCFIPDNRCLIL